MKCLALLLASWTTALCYTALISEGVPSFERDAFNYIVALATDDPEEHDAFTVEEPLERVSMTAADGAIYSCAIPSSTHPIPTDIEGSVVHKSPFDYLEPLASVCSSRIERWWTYEFCFRRHVRQYHDDQEDRMKADYALGYFDADAEEDNQIRQDVAGGKTVKYVRQLFTNGDVCEETQQKRTTEVRFMCEEHSQFSATMVASITEGPTCHYTVNINSPLLCQHPEFKTHATTRVILCNRLSPPVAVTTPDATVGETEKGECEVWDERKDEL